MKLIEDDGTVLEIIDDATGVLLFSKDGGVSMISPDAEDDAEVPPNILFAAAVMVYTTDAENREMIMQEFKQRMDAAH